jgi:hypothetical protein
MFQKMAKFLVADLESLHHQIQHYKFDVYTLVVQTYMGNPGNIDFSSPAPHKYKLFLIGRHEIQNNFY